MRPTRTPSPILRWAVTAVGLLLIVYLAVLALRPSIIDALPAWLGWFGRPGSMPTLGIVVAVLIAVCVLTFRSDRQPPGGGCFVHRDRRAHQHECGAGTQLVLGLSRRQPSGLLHPADGDGQLVKGGIGDFSLSGQPARTPPRSAWNWHGSRRCRRSSPDWVASWSASSGPRWTGCGPTSPIPSPPSWVSTTTPNR